MALIAHQHGAAIGGQQRPIHQARRYRQGPALAACGYIPEAKHTGAAGVTKDRCRVAAMHDQTLAIWSENQIESLGWPAELADHLACRRLPYLDLVFHFHPHEPAV